jgi:hypothetical protein
MAEQREGRVSRSSFKTIAMTAFGVGLACATAAGGVSRALDPVSISVSEGVVASDGAIATPPASVSVGEVVGANDAVVVSPPVFLIVVEAISVQDTVRLAGPTAVGVQSFKARRTPLGVRLSWKVASAVRTIGFNIYRDQNGKLGRLNRALIPATIQARSYSWLDRIRVTQRAVTRRYRLQAVDLSGRRTWVRIAAAKGARR